MLNIMIYILIKLIILKIILIFLMQDKNFMKFIKIHQIKFGFRNNILNAKEMLKWPLLLCLSLLCHVLLYNHVNKQDLY